MPWEFLGFLEEAHRRIPIPTMFSLVTYSRGAPPCAVSCPRGPLTSVVSRARRTRSVHNFFLFPYFFLPPCGARTGLFGQWTVTHDSKNSVEKTTYLQREINQRGGQSSGTLFVTPKDRWLALLTPEVRMCWNNRPEIISIKKGI